MKFNFREKMFRIWYWYVNRVDKNAEILFMNYGFSDPDHDTPLNKENEPNRYSIQLYHHLAIETEIENKDIVEIGCGRGGGLFYITGTHSCEEPYFNKATFIINRKKETDKKHLFIIT